MINHASIIIWLSIFKYPLAALSIIIIFTTIIIHSHCPLSVSFSCSNYLLFSITSQSVGCKSSLLSSSFGAHGGWTTSGVGSDVVRSSCLRSTGFQWRSEWNRVMTGQWSMAIDQWLLIDGYWLMVLHQWLLIKAYWSMDIDRWLLISTFRLVACW